MVLGQGEDESATDVVQETLFELSIPSEALPEEFVKLVVEEWTLAPDTDSSDDIAAVLGNEALRGRGLVIDAGEILITPAAEALLWLGIEGEPRTTAPGETLTLTVGDAIFLPAIPDAEVEDEAPIGLANSGSEAATALSFHTHQAGGSFYGFPLGVSLGDWDMADPFAPDTVASFDDADVLVRLTRTIGEPGALIPTPDAPAVALYFVAAGDLEEVVKTPGGERVYEWPAGKGFLMNEYDEQTLRVVGDSAATVLELSAAPMQASPE